MINFDESSWGLLQVSDRTIADRGTEVVHQDVEGDGKACSTFLRIPFGRWDQVSVDSPRQREDDSLPSAIWCPSRSRRPGVALIDGMMQGLPRC
jgi:hypothetical protein